MSGLRETVTGALLAEDDYTAMADAAIAAFREALLSDTAVEAAGLRLSKGAMFPDAYRTDPEYSAKTDALAKAILTAALDAVTEGRA